MTPWELAKETEHSQQRALFAWANCVAEFGFYAAQYSDCYSLVTRQKHFQARLGLGPAPAPVPELSRLFAVHNQGHGDRIRGAQAKAEGVKAGVPDLMLPVPRFLNWANAQCPGLFIEMKKTKKGVVSEAQDDWGKYLLSVGYAFAFCPGWIKAANIIADYMGSPVRISDD